MAESQRVRTLLALLVSSLGMSTQPATIAIGDTSVVVSHNLGAVPGIVNVEPQDDLGGRSTSITNKTTTHFTLNMSLVDNSNAHVFVTRAYK